MATCVLDTDIVIAALDRADAHHATAAAAFERFTTGRTELVICTVNYAEVLVRPAEDERSLRAAVDAIASLGIRTSSPDAALARVAARLEPLASASPTASRSRPLSGWAPTWPASTSGCVTRSRALGLTRGIRRRQESHANAHGVGACVRLLLPVLAASV